MKNIKTLKVKAALFLGLTIILAPPAQATSQTIKKNDVKLIINKFNDKKLNNFSGFLDLVSGQTNNTSLKTSIKLFKKKNISDNNDWINIYRLLGIYSRIKYKDELIAVLKTLVAIPTDKKEGIPQYKNINIVHFGQAIEKLAHQFGLEYKNIDNRIFEVTLKGNDLKDSFGVYTHSDVVPADKSKWVLENGTKLDPYNLTVIGNNIYGRGTEDDKCSIVVSLYAMKIIKESGFTVNRSIRLLIETTEETSGEGIEYYKKHYSVPAYNIVLDSSYPVVTAEKGFGVIAAKYKVRPGTGSGPEITNITGGLAYNQIPSTSVATITTDNQDKLAGQVKTLGSEFIKENGHNFKIETSNEGKNLLIKVIGKSAHSAAPQHAVNPVALMFSFLNFLNPKVNFRENHFTDAVRYVNENFGLDYFGKKLGMDYKDSFMGPLTAALTLINLKNNELEVAVNIRAPRGKEPEQLKKEIETKLESYKQKSHSDFKIEVSTGKYMFRNLKGEWINTLLNVFGDVTGRPSKPVSISGGTTAKQLPNGVSFGPAMPDEIYTGHTDNEFKKVSNYLFDVQMFTEMFLRIGNLKKME